jgi:hypothetical protein
MLLAQCAVNRSISVNVANPVWGSSFKEEHIATWLIGFTIRLRYDFSETESASFMKPPMTLDVPVNHDR